MVGHGASRNINLWVVPRWTWIFVYYTICLLSTLLLEVNDYNVGLQPVPLLSDNLVSKSALAAPECNGLSSY